MKFFNDFHRFFIIMQIDEYSDYFYRKDISNWKKSFNLFCSRLNVMSFQFTCLSLNSDRIHHDGCCFYVLDLHDFLDYHGYWEYFAVVEEFFAAAAAVVEAVEFVEPPE